MLSWMQELHAGGDVLGSKRGRAARKVMLEQMCVGALTAALLNNSVNSAVAECLASSFDFYYEEDSDEFSYIKNAEIR